MRDDVTAADVSADDQSRELVVDQQLIELIVRVMDDLVSQALGVTSVLMSCLSARGSPVKP
jgi:hypothetical protein